MEEKSLITYKWEGGVYDLEDLYILTKYHQLTPKEFFDITRYDYEVIRKRKEGGN